MTRSIVAFPIGFPSESFRYAVNMPDSPKTKVRLSAVRFEASLYRYTLMEIFESA